MFHEQLSLHMNSYHFRVGLKDKLTTALLQLTIQRGVQANAHTHTSNKNSFLKKIISITSKYYKDGSVVKYLSHAADFRNICKYDS